MNMMKKYKTVFSMVPSAMSIATDTSCQEIIHNHFAADFLRISPLEKLSFSSEPPPDFKIFRRGIALTAADLPIERSIRDGKAVLSDELEFVWPDGVRKVARWSASPIYSEAGVLCGAVATCEEITAQKKLEEELATYHNRFLIKETLNGLTEKIDQDTICLTSGEVLEMKKIEVELNKTNEFIANILESMTDSFFALDNQWRYTYTNREHETAHGLLREEILGKSIWDIHPHEIGSIFYEEYHIAMAEQVPRHFESYGLTAHKNDCLDVHVYPSKDGLLVYYRNVSDRKKYEQELARLERLNLIGQMAAGISHEIRNPLTTVRGFLQILTEKADYAKEHEIFKLMIAEMDRANEIISEYLSLAKNKTLHLQKLNLNLLIEKIVPLISANAMAEDKYIEFKKGTIPELMLDENEIRQLVLNLVRNGLEAMMPETCLTISTGMDHNQPLLEIKDEGAGITPEVLKKLGTPFYTTKDGGTGLGLAVCYSIADRHNAKIDVTSSSQGTTFDIRFQAS